MLGRGVWGLWLGPLFGMLVGFLRMGGPGFGAFRASGFETFGLWDLGGLGFRVWGLGFGVRV